MQELFAVRKERPLAYRVYHHRNKLFHLHEKRLLLTDCTKAGADTTAYDYENIPQAIAGCLLLIPPLFSKEGRPVDGSSSLSLSLSLPVRPSALMPLARFTISAAADERTNERTRA